MDQGKIIEILNRHVFSEDKAVLLQVIADNPERFVGVFRSTTPRLKLMQYLLQSREIRFGDALEEVLSEMLADIGFVNLPKRILASAEDPSLEAELVKRERLSCDQYFSSQDRQKFYLLEQKVRDDHDSTKKRGQLLNFGKKLVRLKALHGELLIGIMYFIDPSLSKNERYYEAEIETLQEELGIPIYLFYNGELFQYLQGNTSLWGLLLNSLQAWRQTVPEQIVLNFDADPQKTLVDLAALPVGIWHKLIANDALWAGGVIQILFPSGASLRQLQQVLMQQGLRRYRIGRGTATYAELAYRLEIELIKHYGPN